MRPKFYVDIEIRSGGASGAAPQPIIAGAVLKTLHGFFRNNPGKYAVALPCVGGKGLFGRLRVFAETRDDLDSLQEGIESSIVVRDYARLGYPRRVPEDFTGEWRCYARYRIPTRKSDRHPGQPLRLRRIEQADEAQLPFFIMSSKSNGQRFGLYVKIDKAKQYDAVCEPDSYGLSVATRAFALPVLP